jgi:hypothetical protein
MKLFSFFESPKECEELKKTVHFCKEFKSDMLSDSFEGWLGRRNAEDWLHGAISTDEFEKRQNGESKRKVSGMDLIEYNQDERTTMKNINITLRSHYSNCKTCQKNGKKRFFEIAEQIQVPIEKSSF